MEENKTNTKISISSLKKNFDDNKDPSKVSLKDKEDEVLSPLNNTIVTEEEALAEKAALLVEKKVKIKPFVSIQKTPEASSIKEAPVVTEDATVAVPSTPNKKIGISSIKKSVPETPVVEEIKETPLSTEAPALISEITEGSVENVIENQNNQETVEAPLVIQSPIPEESSEIFTNYTPYFDKRKDFLLKKVEQIKTKVKTNWKFILITIVIGISIGATMIFVDPNYHSFNNYKTSIIDLGKKLQSGEEIFNLPSEVKINTIDIPDVIVDTEIVEEPIKEEVKEVVSPTNIEETEVGETGTEETTSSGTTISPIIKEKDEILKEVTNEIIKSYFKNIQFQE